MGKWTIRGLVFSALFAAITMAFSFLKFKLPFTAVPISFINFGPMIAGSILGARYGFLALLLAVGVAAAGLPVIGGSGGVSLMLGPTGGFVWVQPIAALLIGFFAERMRADRPSFWKLTAVNFLFGSLFLYPTGVGWLAHKLNLPLAKALVAGMWPFLPGDFLKALICAAVTVAVWRVYPIEQITGQNTNRSV
ncbi:biotin transporter BioY [Effusibacillus pohliae]|uniref:biotin transporter BioY n=1 Tax=Effusibacillus pohliae TaxID=232270 RepID=UPI00037305BB|nr:biotin transporter BioY [Effusibacillus pohliae]